MSRTKIIQLPSGLRLHCAIDGKEGAPWVTLSNSLATNLSLWDELVTSLRDRYCILRYDQRGHGKSDVPDPPYTMIELMDDAVALLDAFGIARTNFLGISMGGATALGLALRYPNRLHSAMMCDSGFLSSPQGNRDWDERIAIARRSGMEAMVNSTIARWFTKPSIAAAPPAIDRVRDMIRSTPLNGFIGCANSLQTFNFSVDLEKVALPCLLVTGAHDGARPATMTADQKRIRGSVLRIIPDAGHLPNIERPEAFNAVVREFLDAHRD